MSQQAAQRKLRQASTNVKHWNVQMNRLMRPIGPGGVFYRFSFKIKADLCHKGVTTSLKICFMLVCVFLLTE